MKVLNNNELQTIAGGCPTCTIVPGVCVAASLLAGGTGAVSWFKNLHPAITYTSTAISVAMMGLSAYYIYDKYTKVDPQTDLTPSAAV